MSLFRRRSLVCQQVVELVTEYLEGALSRSERSRFEQHLHGCPHCSEYLAQMRTIIGASGKLAPADLSPEVQDEFIAIFRRWKSES